jgi:hypothetical protein
MCRKAATWKIGEDNIKMDVKTINCVVQNRVQWRASILVTLWWYSQVQGISLCKYSYFPRYKLLRSRDSSVGIATSWTADGSGF